MAELGGLNGGALARGAAADADQVVVEESLMQVRRVQSAGLGSCRTDIWQGARQERLRGG